jgi:hypothetical protein
MTAGIYVIELGPDTVKVGRSGDVDKRIATHLRHARGHGLDPYRYAAIPAPPELLCQAERECHGAVRTMGGQETRSPEVFAGVHYNPVLMLVNRVVGEVSAYAASLARLRGLSSVQLEAELVTSSPDVRAVVRRLVAS